MALAFSERLKAFRPKQTILEAEGEAAISKHMQGPSGRILNLVHQQRSSKNVNEETKMPSDIYSSQRPTHPDRPLQIPIGDRPTDGNEKKGRRTATRRRRRGEKGVFEEEAAGSKRKAKCFKDEEFYISSVPTNHHMEAGLSVRSDQGFGSNRLEAAVLDLVADDSVGLQKQKSVYHWDKVKTESGAKVKATKTGIYKKWKERSHKKVSLKGTDYEGRAEETSNMSDHRGDNRKFKGGRRQQRSMPNAHVRSEIKDLEQVRKERQTKANRISYIKSKSQKGKKFGKMENEESQRSEGSPDLGYLVTLH